MPLFNDAIQQIITSVSVPNNPTQGLIWNELDSSGALIETWSYTNSSWRSALKNISAGLWTTTNVLIAHSEFSFNADYNIFIKKWTVSLYSTVVITPSNYLIFYLLQDWAPISPSPQFSIVSLGANVSYTKSVDINQLFSFTSGNSSVFEFRLFVNSNPTSCYASSNLSYRLIRK